LLLTHRSSNALTCVRAAAVGAVAAVIDASSASARVDVLEGHRWCCAINGRASRRARRPRPLAQSTGCQRAAILLGMRRRAGEGEIVALQRVDTEDDTSALRNCKYCVRRRPFQSGSPASAAALVAILNIMGAAWRGEIRPWGMIRSRAVNQRGGPDADRHDRLLIPSTSEGSRFGAYSRSGFARPA
jgi:hypothetical protein